MKNRKKASNGGDNIKEIDVGELVHSLSKREEDDVSQVSQNVVKQIKGTQGNAQPTSSSLSQKSQDLPSKLTTPKKTNTEAQPGTNTRESQAVSDDGALSRSKKQRLRLLRKLHERQLGELDILSDGSDVDSQAAPSTPEGGESRRANKKRRNYVERTSSLAGRTSGCTWKDMMCVLFVLLTIVAAGVLKFQEEMFGMFDHARLETDSDADYYEILGLAHSATVRDIKRAYRNKVLEVHPDHHPNCGDCQQKFIQSTKAYETLMDVDKRKIYDQTRGSYEPIMSDFSVSLTSFNYERLVAHSSHIWVIQVYDDLSGNSKYFSSHWDSVAGTGLGGGRIKFGRVNARRDKAVLSMLPMRAKVYPTVMMFSKDTMPSIFSLADMSSRALRKWIVADLPDHVGQTNSANRYVATIMGTTVNPSMMTKISSVENGDIFDVQYEQSTSSMVTVTDKSTTAPPLFSKPCNADVDCAMVLDEAKRRLVVPLTRYNIFTVCGSEELQTICVHNDHIKPGAPVTKAVMIKDETLYQRVYIAGSKNFELDITKSVIVLDDGTDPRHVEMNVFIDEKFPLGIVDRARMHAVPLTVGGMIFVSLLVVAKLGPVQITIAIAGMSIVVGLINAVGTAAILNKLKDLLK